MSEELIRKSEVLKLLDDLGGCDAQDEFSSGWDKAIDEAYSRVDDMQPVNMESEAEQRLTGDLKRF